HGMSHGAWCWDHVVARLERAGHRAVALDLPGHGRRAHERGRASVAAYARAAADAAIQAGLSRAIVVGHSMAGMVIPKVAELIPSRVAHLVFLAAVVLRDGESLLGTQMAAPTRPLFRGLARSGGGVVQYPALVEWSRWMGDLSMGDSRVVAAFDALTPQPLRPWTERVDMTRFYAMRIPRTYVRCLRDAAVTPPRASASRPSTSTPPTARCCPTPTPS
ncbi:MAG: alpha/beta fold hydrolase, partial [Candidatus Rokubacteria bacterium]|nr:alpha/beta fold hydrolase [Candidatus Rokubacteria bacterium]